MKIKLSGVLTGLFVSFALMAGPAGAAEKVTVTLDWVISGYHAPFFIAEEKGYYKKEGLEVTIRRGFGSGRTTKAVGTGTLRFWQAPQVGLSTHRGLGGGPRGRDLLPSAGGLGARSLAQRISDWG